MNKFWTHLKLKNGDKVQFVPPAPDGDRLGGVTQEEREQIGSLKEEIASKQDKIDDLDAIRDGAEKGATALQSVPMAGTALGGIYSSGNRGVTVSGGHIDVNKATDAEIDAKSQNYKPIVPASVDRAVRAGLISNSQITDADKADICRTIGAEQAYGDFVQIEHFRLSETTSWTRTAEPDGTPYKFKSVFITREYPSDSPQVGDGYGRLYFADANNKEISVEQKRRAQTGEQVNLAFFEKKGGIAFCMFTQTQSRNSEANLQMKGYMSFMPGFGDVSKIYTNAGDKDPAGTYVTIYAIRN